LLVTALRSFFEEQGTDFSAQWAGKWKMVVQCLAAGLSLWRLWYFDYDSNTGWGAGANPPTWSTWSLRLVVWAAIVMTIYSGWGYVQTAIRLLRKPS
jgi:CDP-diacylglycerol--glycerol-3-phosphate 3-phosphatidyltransferase